MKGLYHQEKFDSVHKILGAPLDPTGDPIYATLSEARGENDSENRIKDRLMRSGNEVFDSGLSGLRVSSYNDTLTLAALTNRPCPAILPEVGFDFHGVEHRLFENTWESTKYEQSHAGTERPSRASQRGLFYCRYTALRKQTLTAIGG